MAVNAIARLIVHANTEASIAHQRVEPSELLCQLPRDLVRLLEVLEIALPPFNLTDVPKFLQSFLRFFRVLFLI